MLQAGSQLEEVIGQFRKMLPAQSATAMAIDQREPWEKIAVKALNDGYTDFVEEFSCLIEACLRRSS